MTPAGLQVARRRDGSLINWRKVLEEVWLAFDNSKEEENDKTKDYDAEPPHENLLSAGYLGRHKIRSLGCRRATVSWHNGRQNICIKCLPLPCCRLYFVSSLTT